MFKQKTNVKDSKYQSRRGKALCVRLERSTYLTTNIFRTKKNITLMRGMFVIPKNDELYP